MVTFAPIRVAGGGCCQVLAASPAFTELRGGADTQGQYVTELAAPGATALCDVWTVDNAGIGNLNLARQCSALVYSTTEAAGTVYAGTGDAKNGGSASGGGLLARLPGKPWVKRSGGPQWGGNHQAPPLPSDSSATPRPTGHLLVAEPGPGSATTYLWAGTYALGVWRAPCPGDGTDGTAWTTCTVSGTAPSGSNNWYTRAVAQDPAHLATVYAAFYNNAGAPAGLYVCTAAHATTPNFVPVTAAGAPAIVEDIRIIGGQVYCTCAGGGAYMYTGGTSGTWYSLNGTGVPTGSGNCWSKFDGYIDNLGNTVLVIANHSPQLASQCLISITIPPGWAGGTGLAWANMTGTVQIADVPGPSGEARSWWRAGSSYHNWLGGLAWFSPFVLIDTTSGTPTGSGTPANPNIYVCGSEGAARKIGTSGWTISNNGMPQFLGHPVAASPVGTYAAQGDSDWGFLGWNDGVAFDASHTQNDGPPGGAQCFAIDFDDYDSPATVWTGCGNKYLSPNANGAVGWRLVTTPGAANWTDLLLKNAVDLTTTGHPVLGPKIPTGLCVLRGSPYDSSGAKAVLAAVDGGGVWRWTSAGGWLRVDGQNGEGRWGSATVGDHTPIAHVAGSQYVYAWDKTIGIFRSADAGVTWTKVWGKTSTDPAGQIGVHPVNVGELWISAPDGLYQITGAHTGIVGSGATLNGPIGSPVAVPGPVYAAPPGTVHPTKTAILATTQDTGTGSGMQVSYDDGATWHDAVGDGSLASCNCGPESMAVGPDGRIYVSGSNIVATGYVASSSVTSLAFTERQTSQNFLAASGVLGLWNNQASPPAGGAATLAGSMVSARIVLNDCQAATTVTGPPGWVLAADGKAGTANTQARTQIWYYPNCVGGLYGTSGSLATFTCSDTSASLKGVIAEWTTPTASVQALDQSGTLGGVTGTFGALACTATDAYSGGLGLALAGALLTGAGAGQTWTTPSGWASNGSANNATLSFDSLWLTGLPAGTITLTPVITPGTWTLASWASCAATFYAKAATTLAPTTGGTLPNGTVSVPYPSGTAVTCDGGVAPYTFTVTSGALPPGLALNAATGAITGTPTGAVGYPSVYAATYAAAAGGSYTFTVTAADCSGQTVPQTFTITIGTTVDTVAVATTSLPAGTGGAVYTATVAPSGGTGPYTWTVT